MKKLITLVVALCLVVYMQAQKTSIFNFAEWVHPDSILLPQPCETLPLSALSQVIEIDDSLIEQKTAGLKSGNYSLSCFYKWNDPSTPHAGMLFQIMKNGVPENKDFISRTYQSKIIEGEFIQHLDKKVTFKKHSVGKVDIIYNPVTHSAYWHIGDNYMFHLIFNLHSLNEDKFLYYLDNLVPEINKNMLLRLLE